jgi:hypothetical protein
MTEPKFSEDLPPEPGWFEAKIYFRPARLATLMERADKLGMHVSVYIDEAVRRELKRPPPVRPTIEAAMAEAKPGG